MATVEELEAFGLESTEVVKKGEYLYEQIKKELEGQHPAGHFVVINVDTGEHVTAETSLEASEKAEEKFQRPFRGFIRQIVGPYPDVLFAGCPL